MMMDAAHPVAMMMDGGIGDAHAQETKGDGGGDELFHEISSLRMRPAAIL
jgi:hypothetical protein